MLTFSNSVWSVDGRPLPSDVPWDDLPDGDIMLKIGSFNLCSFQVIRTDMRTHEDDPIVSPTQPWTCDEADPEFDYYLQDAHRAGFFHVAEYVCQDEEPRHTAKVLLIQQDGTSEWIRNANLHRLRSFRPFNTRRTPCTSSRSTERCLPKPPWRQRGDGNTGII